MAPDDLTPEEMGDGRAVGQEIDEELRGLFGRLSAQVPEDAATERALARAGRTLALADVLPRQQQGGRHAAGSQPLRFWLWRVVMPIGLLTTAALVVAFMFTSTTAQVASAAEILKRAAKARAEFDGWYTLEVRHPETGDWHTVQRVNPVEGKWFERNSDDPEAYGKHFHDVAWTYGDTTARLFVQYRADTRTATIIGDVSLDNYSWDDLPINEAQLMDWMAAEGRYDARSSLNEAGDMQVDLSKRPTPLGSDGRPDPNHVHWPVRFQMTFTSDQGLLDTVTVQQTAEDALVPYARVKYGTQPIRNWEDLIDETITVEDLRPDEATRKLIDAVDEVWRDGLGFDTAIVVRRAGDHAEATLDETGSLRLYAERDGAWAKFVWKKGHEVAGWPEPELDAVLAHLAANAPDVAVMTDGQTCWWRWGADKAWQTKPLVDVTNIAYGARLVGEIWPSREWIFYDPGRRGVEPTTRRHPDYQPNGVVLEAVGRSQWAGDPEGELRVSRIRRVLFLEDLGPLPVEKISEEYDAEGELWSRTQVIYGLEDFEMHRSPVRVPLYWRSTRESPRSNPLPQYYHLMPQPGATLGAEWFTDPRERWPREAREESH
ncbi:MAG: hypothetical protein AAF333_09270 [Planctomycetota bacterium]